MNSFHLTPPASDRVLAAIRGELTTSRRWLYRLFLLAASVTLSAILSLWLTEPRPLPLRLDVAFAALSAIGVGWVGVLTWILTRRRCPTALDRVATGWMATLACAMFLVVSLPIAIVRGSGMSAAGLGVTGFGLLGVAVWMLCRAYSFRAELLSKLAEIERKSASK